MAFDNASECTLPGASVASALTSNVAEEHRLNGSEHPTALAALGSFSFASEWLHFKHPSGRPVFSSCSASAALGQVPRARVREVDSPAARATACQVGPGDDAHKDPGSMARAAGAWPKKAHRDSNKGPGPGAMDQAELGVDQAGRGWPTRTAEHPTIARA